jgi:4'-phosphopantetheinyl transferase
MSSIEVAMRGICIFEADLARAASITKPQRRQQFIAGRWLLRQMLAEALGGRAENIVIDAVAGAPPRVLSRPDLHLSVSHSGGWVAVAVADRPVGIDIEGLGARRDSPRFARWVCGPDEWRAWRALEGKAADDALIAHWTRKEAWLKREGGEVMLTRMRRLQADAVDAPSANVATWRVGDQAMLSLCADAVAAVQFDADATARLQQAGFWRMHEQGDAARARRRDD